MMDNIIKYELFKKTKEYEVAMEALQTIKDLCNMQMQEDCEAGRCPLYEWCNKDRLEYPCNWF